jgi:lactoylglutathione lyase
MKKIIPFILVVAFGITAFSVNHMLQNKKPVLNHAALSVVNLQKSTAFYSDMLQLEVIPEPFKDGKHSWFKIGEHSQLHLIEASKGIIAHDKSTHLCFSVESIEAMIERLEKNKIDYGNWLGDSKTPTVRPDGVKQIFLKDPDGYWLEINNDKY